VFYAPTAAGEQSVRIAMPAGYDSRIPVPLVLYMHGSGGNATSPITDIDTTVYSALVANGFAVASSDQHGNNWGNDSAVADMVTLYKYVTARYAVGPILLMGQSMGGLSSLRTLAARQIPGVVGWLGIYPVTNLANLYSLGTYTSAIKTAYGIASDGSDYASKTAGADPNLLDASLFRGVPMRFYASTGDAVVPRAQNSDLLAARVANINPEATIVVCSGNHGDLSHFQPSDVVSFFNRCLLR
jgi:acetyl esterase/lipase